MPRGINTPGMEELTGGDETSGVTPEVDGVSGVDRKVQGGDVNSPAIQDIKASGDRSSGEGMASRLGPAARLNPQRGTVARRGSEISTCRHSDGAVSARPKHGALLSREYDLLAPEEPVGYPAAAEPQKYGDSNNSTMVTGGSDIGETETRDWNGQQAILVCSQLEDSEEESIPPNRHHAFNACGHQGEEGGVPRTQQRALPARSQGREGDTPNRPCAPPAGSWEME